VTAMAKDGQGNAFLIDSSNHALRVVLGDGTIHTIAGGTGSGYVDGNGLQAKFNTPSGLVVRQWDHPHSGTYDIYIADTGNHVIRVVHQEPSAGTGGFFNPVTFDASAWTVTTIAGLSATPGA